jgi:hypothetical protein
LLAEAQSAALGLGAERAWVERVVVATQPETQSDDADDRGSLADLQEWLADGWQDGELAQRIDRELADFCSKLPSEIRSTTDDPLLKALIAKDHAMVLRGAYPYLAGKLKTKGSASRGSTALTYSGTAPSRSDHWSWRRPPAICRSFSVRTRQANQQRAPR